MTRDFTDETKKRLMKEIDDINKKTWSPVTDFIGDAFLYGGKWIGILSLENNLLSVESYQRNILDMTDMTKKELNEIFEDVYATDAQFSKKFVKLNQRESIYNSKLSQLASMIQPNFSICDAATIKSMTNEYNERLKAVDWKINEIYERELDQAAKQAALKSAKGIVGGVLKVFVDVLSLPVKMVKNIVTNNVGEIFTDTWSIIDDVFSVGSNFVGLTALGMGYGISAINGSNAVKNEAIKQSEAYSGAKGLTDVLEADEKMNGESEIKTLMKKGSQLADSTSTFIDIKNSVKGFVEKPASMVETDFGFNYKMNPLKKADMIGDYKDNYSHWQGIYEKLGKDSHYVMLNNISKGYKYLENLWDIPEGEENVIEGVVETGVKGFNNWYKSLCDCYDFAYGAIESLISEVS